MALILQENIRNFYERYLMANDFIIEINNETSNDEKIKNVQIPVNLSQTLAYHFILLNPICIGLKTISPNLLKEGGLKGFDLKYTKPQINIEVKATGSNTFQRFRPKALTADYIIWLNFHSKYLYDVAVFKPHIINQKNKNEVEFIWKNLSSLNPIKLYRDISI